MLANTQKRQEISGNLFITAKQGAGKEISMPAVMLVQWPDKIRLEIQDPVGSTLALFVVNGAQFWFYDKQKPEILTGPLKKLPASLGVVSGGAEFVRAMLARPPLDEWKDAIVEHHSATPFPPTDLTKYVYAVITWSDRSREPEDWFLNKPDGGNDKFQYEDYQARAGVSFPQKIRVTHVDKGGEIGTAAFAWRDWQPFVPQEKKLFLIPQQQLFGKKIKALH
ncbi:MAG: hypothetical protein ACXWQO_16760 [Bdellovibrionota bacterium]